jgi:hypothetical protein
MEELTMTDLFEFTLHPSGVAEGVNDTYVLGQGTLSSGAELIKRLDLQFEEWSDSANLNCMFDGLPNRVPMYLWEGGDVIATGNGLTYFLDDNVWFANS